MQYEIISPQLERRAANRKQRLKSLPLEKMGDWAGDDTPNPPGTPGRKRVPVRTRFMAKVSSPDTNGCWMWNSIKDPAGYGLFGIRDRSIKAHKIAWILFRGPVPSGLFVCHKCDIPACVNPDHLFLGTPKQNTADAISKQRMLLGEKNGQSKLTTTEVIKIRSLSADGVSHRELANIYGIQIPAIFKIVKRQRWKHI